MNENEHLGIAWSALRGTDLGEITAFHGAFNQADEFLRFLGRIYRLSIPVPVIKIFSGDEFAAHAAQSHDIYLSSGVVKYSLRIFDEMFTGGLPDGIEKPNKSYLIMNVLLFVVAHEFFHIARGHFNVLRDHPGCHHALEYDADGMAATALYRWNQYRLSTASMTPEQRAQLRDMTPGDFKNTIMYSVFWPIRAQIGSTIAAPDWSPTHPCWHVRLWAVIRKLAFVDNVTVVNGKPVESPKVEDDIKNGIEQLSALEAFYGLRKGIPRANSTLDAFFERDVHGEYFLPIHRRWSEIKESVRKYSYLETLRDGPM